MRDPIDELSNFDPGADVNPPPPSEIRRRGDRLRRRNHLLAAAGAAALVALIVAPLAVLGAQQGDDAPDPAPSPSLTPTPSDDAGAWPTRIPAGFPLASGMPEDDGSSEYQLDLPSRDTQWLGKERSLQACGRSVTPGDSVDWLTTRLSYGASAQIRELQLFADDTAAAAYVDSIRQVFEACPEDDSNSGDALGPADGTPPFFTITVNAASLSEDSLVITSASDGIGQGVIHAIRVRNAVLVESAGNEGPGDQVDSLAVASRENLADVVAAMNQLVDGEATGGDSGSDAATSTSPGNPGDIPDGYPLADGWPEPDGDTVVVGPTRDHGPMEFGPCDEPVIETEYADRLHATYQAPEDFRGRQLTTYSDADAAVDAVAALVAAFEACPEDEREDGYIASNEVRALEVGGESWAIRSRDTFDGSETPWGSTIVIVRLGRAVLISDWGGHSGYPNGDGQQTIGRMIQDASASIDQMCRFTEAGC